MISRPSLCRVVVPAVVLWLCAGVIGFAREEISLCTGWRFAFQPAGRAFETAELDDREWTTIDLPHSWNATDGEDGGGDYKKGDGWYRRHFATDPHWAQQRVFVDFAGANRTAEVWLNGKRLGQHRGGYSRFRFEATDALRSEGDNVLAVRVNNAADDLIPIGGDFTFWGGLHRNVTLIVVPPMHIDLSDHASPGVYLTTTALDDDHADVHVRTLVAAQREHSGSADIRVVVRDAKGTVVADATAPCGLEPGKTPAVEQMLRIASPHRWGGRSDPYLYTATVELRSGQTLLDTVVQPLGLRTFTVDPERGLFLNGRPFAAHGVNRHQDWIDVGLAITPAQQREDFALIEEIGATVVRLCHYQHDDYAYELADRDGLAVWAEVGFVGQVPRTAEGLDNAVEQLRELIRQNYNHPSIFCWSVGNETSGSSDELIARLAKVAKEEDASRFTTYASHHPNEDARNFHTDLLGYNRYFGWYGSSYAEFDRWLDDWHAKHPTRPLGISEYGAGASIYQHEQNPPIRTKTQSKGPWHPEEWQNEYHEHAWLTLKSRPYVWGAFIWNMFDFGVDSRKEGDTAGRNDKGLVTYDRRTRKDVFFWYKANWTDEPLVYISSRRDSLRLEPSTPVKVYSNCDTVELWVNGESLGQRTSDDRRFVWADVKLSPGPNRLFVLGKKGRTEVTDSCGWTLTTGTPYRPADDSPAKP